MKVIYDTSLLGASTGAYGFKSGLFRVTETLASELMNFPECELTFGAGVSLEIWSNSQRYLESHSLFKEVPFVSKDSIINARRKLYNLTEKSINISHKLGWRRTKKMRESLLSLLAYNFQPLSIQDLKNQDIYHSLYHAIPQRVKTVRSLTSFLTVNDIIPILYPHFFGLDKNFTKAKKTYNLKASLDSLNRDDWLICISHSTKNDLCNYLGDKIDQQKVFVTHLAASDLFYPCLNEQKFAAIKQRYGIPNAPYILSLSTLEPRKNIEQTIRCFAKLVQQEKVPDLHLVLAGKKGWNYDSIFSEISDNPQIKERVICTNYVADEDLAALYSNALVFVYPSFYEGFGLPPLEAMQCGTPVITSNTSSLPEVVGEAGIMVDPQDEDELCQQMLKVYNDSSLRNSLAVKAKERAKKFSWSKCAQETIEAYQYALANR
ncbi:MAG: glycosyltransferase family 1 protein [Spirulinaceae cyanobacterium]